MERELWNQLYTLALELDKRCWTWGYPAAVIVGVYLWAVIHDRPTCWACEGRHWPEGHPWDHLPSQSCMSRRLRSQTVEKLFEEMEQAIRENPGYCWVKFIDGKPLPIGGYSKDPDAKWGRATSSKAKGYKLYAIVGRGSFPLVWHIDTMNVNENKVAQQLLSRLQGQGYLVGDSMYDSNPVHDAALAHNHQLIAPRRHPNAGGLGHHRHSPGRIRCLELLQHHFGKALLKQRKHIERVFGWLTSFGGGLSPLPSWVRRTWRVKEWIRAKMLIDATKLSKRNSKLVTA
jgi:hypothetical protein